MNTYEITLKTGEKITLWGDSLRAALEGTTLAMDDVADLWELADFNDNGAGS